MSRFIDANNVVDKANLRSFVLEELVQLKRKAEVSCVEHRVFWDKALVAASTSLFDKDRERAMTTIKQLVHLPHYIQMWIEMSVDTQERFDFFVMAKAHEIHSNDQTKDYFWALQIRHDQLVALVNVLTLLTSQMKTWIGKTPASLFDDSVFSGLTDMGVEDQVYLEAEKIYQERTHGID